MRTVTGGLSAYYTANDEVSAFQRFDPTINERIGEEESGAYSIGLTKSGFQE